MNMLKEIFEDKKARVKKIFGVIGGIFITIIVVASFFSEGGSFFGIIISVLIFAVAVFGAYVWLKRLEDLPDIFY